MNKIGEMRELYCSVVLCAILFLILFTILHNRTSNKSLEKTNFMNPKYFDRDIDNTYKVGRPNVLFCNQTLVDHQKYTIM